MESSLEIGFLRAAEKAAIAAARTMGYGNRKFSDQVAVEAMREELNRLKMRGTVVIGVPNPGTPVLDSRAKGISDTLAAKAPGITVLGPYQTYSDPNQNLAAWQALVNANPTALVPPPVRSMTSVRPASPSTAPPTVRRVGR